eukprot:TRINITY_DN400_c0_g1_i2.p1 TRINITY_DN400_c0_g1~~TRINITY_DN400_c0_g1_i2.p1  ORF type:complete len:585 (+),score=228.57 TRINITY_DN400_c0_g1_i2:79-1833(+)
MRRISRVGVSCAVSGSRRGVRYQTTTRGFSSSSASYASGYGAKLMKVAPLLTTGIALGYLSKNVFYADSDANVNPAPEEKSKEIEEKLSRKLAKQKLPDPTRAILYVSPDGKWTVYGTKDSLRLVKDEITGNIKKRGYGWSGCAASQTASHFWLVADSEKKFLFKINFKSGTVSRLTLDKAAKLTDMEAVTAVPQTAVDDPRFEELFLVCSSSTNKTGTPKTERCRISFVQIPVQECHRESPTSKAEEEATKDHKKSKKSSDKEEEKFEAFTEGENQFTAQDVRNQILDLLLTKYATEIDTSKDLIAKEGGLDIEGACFYPAKSRTDTHKLFLGLRGPQTKDHRACIISFVIPRGAKRDPAQWKLSEDVAIVDLNGFSIRDMCLSVDQKHVYLLAGSLGQDKTEESIKEYPIYQWKAGTDQVERIGAVPRFKAGDLNHTGLSATAWEEFGMKEGELPADEVPDSWTSPEGIDVYRNKYGQERLLVVWDNNDVGCFAEIAMKDFREERREDRVQEGGRRHHGGHRHGRREEREEKERDGEERRGGGRRRRREEREEREEKRRDRRRNEEELRAYDNRKRSAAARN